MLPILYEGHGFVPPENRTSFYAITEHFLAQHFSGVYEMAADDWNDSSLYVAAGGEQKLGISEQLKTMQSLD